VTADEPAPPGPAIHHEGFTVDSYRIGVSIVLANGVSPVLAIISRDLLGIRGPIDQISKQFSAWNTKLLGVAGILGGTAIIGGLMKIAQHGDKLLDQQDKMMRSGIAYADVLRLQGTYYANIAKSVPTSTAAEFLKTTNELRAVTGNTDAAAALAPKALMVDTLLSSSLGREAHGEYYKLLRSAEMKGISTDPAKLEQFTDQAFSFITAFGGKLSAEDFQTLARRGGTAFMNAKPDAIGPLAVLAADLGGSAAGTTLMTLQQLQMGATTLTKQQGQTLANLGLLDTSNTTPTGFGGSRLQLAPGAMTGSLEHAGDLPGWIRDVVYPALAKASNGDEAMLQSLISKMSPNRNAAKLIEMFGNPKFLDQQGKDLGLAGQVESIPDAYKHFTERNPLGVRQAFDRQFESMWQAIGGPMMQAAMPIMRDVTAMFTAFGQFANGHPEAIKVIAEGIGALGIALVGAGAATLIALGGVPAIVVGLISAAAGLVAVNWSSISAGFSAAGSALYAIGEYKWQQIVGVFTGITSAIASFIDSIAALYDRVKSFIAPNHPADPQFKKNLDDANKSYVPMRLEPGNSQPKATPISLSLNVDGHTLAQAVSDQLSALLSHPSGAPAPDGGSRFFHPDLNTSNI
jgi:hypothetical protein